MRSRLTPGERSGTILAMKARKNPHAVALGRLGGLKGGPATAKKLSPEERSASARHAVNARWRKWYKANRPRTKQTASD